MNNEKQLLQNLYTNLVNAYIREEKKNLATGKSVYLALLKSKSVNSRTRVLLSAAVPVTSFDFRCVEDLLKLGYIQYTDQQANITLTSLGIWEVEFTLKLIDQLQLLKFNEDNLFDCFSKTNKALKDEEKVILFSLISARAFSENSTANFSQYNEKIYDVWKLIVQSAADFLFNNRIIADAKVREDLFGGLKKKVSLNPIIHCFSYATQDLVPKTNGLFFKKDRKYYLKLYKNEQIKETDLIFLFGLIFENKLDEGLMDRAYKFCCYVSYNNGVQAFSLDKYIFATPSYDELIHNALRSLMLNL